MRHASSVVLLVLVAAAPSGCGLPFFERWAGEDVVRREVVAPPDTVWTHVRQRVRALGLIVEEVRPEDRLVQLGWITLPGDGRLYLRCDRDGPVGSASLRPRIRVLGTGRRSSVVIGSETRATGGRSCASTGRFEDWLGDRLEPALLAAERSAAGRAEPASER